jgi:large repetitive protein
MRLVRLVSVTAVTTATCALWALPASAATVARDARHPSTTSVSVSPGVAWVGASVKLSATVKSSGGTPTGTVTFRSLGRTLCTARLSRGSGACKASFSAAGGYTVRGSYSGDRTHLASVGAARLTVRRSRTITTITSPAYISSSPAGTPFTLTATVTGGSTPTGTVSFRPNNLGNGPMPGYLVCNATLVKGTGSCKVDPPKGTWGFILYTATYSGDATHARSVSTGEHKLITPDITKTALTFNPSPATQGKQVTLTADVTDQPGDSLATAFGGPDQVTFSIGGVPIPGCTKVTVTDPTNGPNNIATCTYTPTTTGQVSVTAAYLGDEYATTSSDTETLTVNP